MKKLIAFAIYDIAAGAYMRPWFVPSDQVAIRSFTDICSDADHPVGQHPDDYSLFRIGGYDEDTGKLLVEDRECIITGPEAVSRSRKMNGAALQAAVEETVK